MANKKPVIVLSALVGISIAFGVFFATKYISSKKEVKTLIQEKETLVQEKEKAITNANDVRAKAEEYETANIALSQQIEQLDKEKRDAYDAAKKAEKETGRLHKELESTMLASEEQKNRVNGLEAKTLKLQEELGVVNSELENVKDKANKYKEEHMYPNSIVDEMKTELTKFKGELKNYELVLEKTKNMYEETKIQHEKELNEARERLQSYCDVLCNWLTYIDETYLGRVRKRIEELTQGTPRLEKAMERAFEGINVKSFSNQELYCQLIAKIFEEEKRQERLEKGCYKPLVEREKATLNVLAEEVVREQEE